MCLGKTKRRIACLLALQFQMKEGSHLSCCGPRQGPPCWPILHHWTVDFWSWLVAEVVLSMRRKKGRATSGKSLFLIGRDVSRNHGDKATLIIYKQLVVYSIWVLICKIPIHLDPYIYRWTF